MSFAQVATPGAVELAGFLGCLFFLVAGANALMKLVDRFRGQRETPKREVSFAERLVSQVELGAVTARVKKLEETVDAIRDELKQDKTDILQAGEERAEKLHNRINDVLRAVSEVRGEMHSRRMDT